ncbi:MAG: iron-containing alcohol dehydrogenase [Halieaceae bacterium]
MFEATDWGYPNPIWFGTQRSLDLPLACNTLAIDAPLLITDQGLADLDVIQELVAALQGAGLKLSVFSGVQGNPTGANVEAGVAAFHAGDCDGVIAVGGGSALDVGKTVALVAKQESSLWNFADMESEPMALAPEALVPVVAVPTTAGTGSEVGRAAVILDEDNHSKKVLWHPSMLPNLVISDPSLTVGLPANVTAWTGIDALVHALEAFMSPNFHPMSQGIAVEAIRMISQWLPEAVADGSNLEARGNMLVAASMGAVAFQKGLGSIHSVSHVIGGLYNTHHGLTNAIVLPFGVKQNMDVVADRLAYLSRVLQLPGGDANAFLDFLLAFRQQLNIPENLAALDVDESRAQEVGRIAELDPCTATNAKPIDAAGLETLFRASVRGDLAML